ncbi:MAG TPA: protein kinase [Steroidobacteraceae bacterium]|nr:protein kinase [Steroidobacteraceae bacterium]
MPSRLLVVDRDPRYAEWLCHHLEALCPDATVTSVTIHGLDRLQETLSDHNCDVLMVAAPFGSSPEDPEALGIELLRQLREQSSTPPVIIVAEEGNELTAVRALQLGAVDYIPKRLMTPERLKTAVKMALRRIEKRVARRLAALAEEAEARARSAAEEAQAAAEAGSPMPDPMPAPDFIPGYTIRALIGDSEKAAVYLATSSSLGHNIALKVSKTMRDEAAGRQFLEREYTAIVAIKDPAVVRIYDYGVHNGHEFIAMEYLPRGDLKARIHQRMTEEEALRYVEQIAMALQVVHTAGLLHRDLKPANVMLRENGNIALIDFGLARSLDGSTTQSTRTGVLRGSPYYMSPEQALGEPLDVRSDFYSLGVILYEMLTGRRPFTGSSAMDVLQQHVHSPMPPLPSAFAHLEPLLGTLLAKSRDERFAKALEVAEAAAAARRAMESEPRTTAA